MRIIAPRRENLFRKQRLQRSTSIYGPLNLTAQTTMGQSGQSVVAAGQGSKNLSKGEALLSLLVTGYHRWRYCETLASRLPCCDFGCRGWAESDSRPLLNTSVPRSALRLEGTRSWYGGFMIAFMPPPLDSPFFVFVIESNRPNEIHLSEGLALAKTLQFSVVGQIGLNHFGLQSGAATRCDPTGESRSILSKMAALI